MELGRYFVFLLAIFFVDPHHNMHYAATYIERNYGTWILNPLNEAITNGCCLELFNERFYFASL